MHATIESESERHITLFGQKAAPGRSGSALLYPLSFCRECGKEYYAVALMEDADTGEAVFLPSNSAPQEGIRGYLFINSEDPWPADFHAQLERLPEDWLEEKNGQLSLIKSRKKYLPQAWQVRPDGTAAKQAGPDTIQAWFLEDRFAFCPSCLVSYDPRLSDFTKLATLGTEGRSTATTILSMSTVSHLGEEPDLGQSSRKFLCFSDNRQDASLQSGHFNDFVETGLIRSALYNALVNAGPGGLSYENLPEKVFEALGAGYADGKFPAANYASVPDAKFNRAILASRAFCSVLEYRIYSDLRRGWRIVAPNLEQCGLLEIEYLSLDELCGDDASWQGCGALATAAPAKRKLISLAFLDFLRSRLAIRADCLDRARQEELARQSRQQLIEPWLIENANTLHYSTVAWARPKRATDSQKDIFLTPRSRFGKWLASRQAFPKSSPDEITAIISGLLQALHQGGIIEPVAGRDEPGFQLSSAAMLWKAGDGTRARHDRFRVRHTKGEFGRTNPFFVDFYRNAVKNGHKLRSGEHTAQVPSELRERREQDFREAALPVLFCSPTMELGVDIAELNAVGMRNVPPTPANYAQRSGRAGRSGQPALVLTYCAQGNSHDQHFFRKPEQMVAGSVSTPRLDLANEDLIRAHIHAIWLACSGLDLGTSLADLLDTSGQNPTLALNESVLAALADASARTAAAIHARNLLAGLEPELANCSWYNSDWLAATIREIPERFEQACDRWRNIYRSAARQMEEQHRIMTDASRSKPERDQAEKLYGDAKNQRDLLIDSASAIQADFYSYRYFASEGFLPGYNFPRLPLTAFIPGKRGSKNSDGCITRPRFLAISEFGPGSIIYHEGSKYAITRVLMDGQDESALGTARLCENCGWLEHDATRDLCEMCGQSLPGPMRNLFRMRNVATRQRDRINSDEEERLRHGYQLTSGYRFVEHGGMPSHQVCELAGATGEPLIRLKYGHGATLWRINMGWLNRPKTSPAGFLLDKSRGAWLRDNSKSGKSDDPDIDLADPATAASIDRVIPYVEDRRNCLVLEPLTGLDQGQMVSLLSALKQAIQQLYQLEEFELASEIMPTRGEPKTLLLVEAAEGGAGVLRHLVEDAAALPAVARAALAICHFDEAGNDLGKAESAEDPCGEACYDCLMNYGNQRHHRDLNRHAIRPFLLDLASASVTCAKPEESAQDRLSRLKRECDSKLEQDWLDFLAEHKLRLPDSAQHRLSVCNTVADFWYEKARTAIYMDGPHHQYQDRELRDSEQTECLEDQGIGVIRFGEGEQWLCEIKRHASLFGYKADKRIF